MTLGGADEELDELMLEEPRAAIMRAAAERGLERILLLARERDPSITREQVRAEMVGQMPELEQWL